MMKRNIILLLCVIVLSGCSQHSNYQHQLEMAEAVIENNPDSAWTLLGEIPALLLGEGEERARYNLLLTEAAYKLYKPFDNDSLINYSIDFYNKNDDLNRLAMAYYYKGGVWSCMGDMEQATLCVKKAEELALNTDDELLKCKIYDFLGRINNNTKNIQLEQHYAHLLLESASKLNQPMWLSIAYEKNSIVNIVLRNEKKAHQYMDSCMKQAEHCSDSDKVYIYTNYANILFSEGNYPKAKHWIEKAALLKPLANQYIMLGEIYHHEGDTLQARQNWEKVIAMGEARHTINAYKYLARLYNERRDYFKVAQMLAKADSVKTFYNEELRTSQIAAIQQQYDKAIVENSLAEEKNNTLTMFAVILILIIVVLLALVYYQRRVSQYKSAISGYVTQINADRQRIMELESTSKDSEKEVSILKADIEHIQQISAGKLGRGKDLYEQIAKKERPRSFTKSKEQDFVDYYAYTFHQQYYRLVQPYQALTLRQTSFLILQEMGLDDKAIGELFDVSASAVRNYRHRLK